MSTFQLDKLLYQVVHEPEVFEAFMADPAAVAAGYRLSEAERAALLGRDVRALFELGGNGYLVTGLAGRLGMFGPPGRGGGPRAQAEAVA